MEFGNICFGNSRGEKPIPRTAAFEGPWQEFCDELKINWHGYPEDGCSISYTNGVLENTVFAVRQYDWGADCDCGFDDEVDAWHKANPHKPDCYQNELDRRTKGKRKSYSSQGREYGRIQKALCKERGLEYPRGCMVHCDCGKHEAVEKAFEGRDHGPACRFVQPNFLYKPTGFRINWYKYPFRDSYMTPPVTPSEWRKIVRACIDSVRSPVVTSPSNEEASA